MVIYPPLPNTDLQCCLCFTNLNMPINTTSAHSKLTLKCNVYFLCCRLFLTCPRLKLSKDGNVFMVCFDPLRETTVLCSINHMRYCLDDEIWLQVCDPKLRCSFTGIAATSVRGGGEMFVVTALEQITVKS